jgi:glycerate 2-kinase
MSIIKNKEELGTSELRRNALEILEAGLGAIETEKILRNKVRVENGVLYIKNGEKEEESVSLPSSSRLSVPSPDQVREHSGDLRSKRGGVVFVGIGKCALDGAIVMEEILGDYLSDGAVIDVRPVSEAGNLKKLKYFEGTHPLPSEQNVEATKEILRMVKDLNENDLVITLISGGGSALFELPESRFNLDMIIEKTKELTARGADIYELNAARKEMSQVKGGKFAKIIAPAKIVSLIFSDVLGNDISVIASGPTAGGEAKNILLVSNHDALVAMKNKAEELGFNSEIETEKFSGNATEVGRGLAERMPKPKTCILLGGETTVLIKNPEAVGGRNQEMVIAALPHMQPDSVLVCAASDGWDNSDHAGALADLEFFEKSKSLNLSPEEFLNKNESYNFCEQIQNEICTGKLGSNVSDLCILIYK